MMMPASRNEADEREFQSNKFTYRLTLFDSQNVPESYFLLQRFVQIQLKSHLVTNFILANGE